ncbi:alpha-ribazole phosphatase [Clostridium manihotivorum]|uniref:phosphoglycerate mutase (2,3-diphosphoglycerate-dependent) n=2 Tax=Clostridium manihotivorum TaxID=2320868 RepID=A0A410E0I9_9CLOT|nr:alpha-ribazole phosphatase [Clostridium manihotivorum]
MGDLLMKLIFIRHGETEANNKGIYQGTCDYPLSNNGIIQNINLKSKLGQMNINKVYYSSLKRAKVTADMVFDFSKEDIKFLEEPAFNEIDFGKWEGKDYRYIDLNYHDEFQNFIKDYRTFMFPEGESFKAFYSRVSLGIEKIISESKGEEIVAVVAHGGTIRAAICYLLSLGHEAFYKFNINHGCYTLFTIYDESAVLEVLNG